MKKTIEIECPDGYKPVYNAETGKVEIVPSSSTERIKSFTDATNEMGVCLATYMRENQSIESLSRLQLIIDALNEGHKFNLLTGTVSLGSVLQNEISAERCRGHWTLPLSG